MFLFGYCSEKLDKGSHDPSFIYSIWSLRPLPLNIYSSSGGNLSVHNDAVVLSTVMAGYSILYESACALLCLNVWPTSAAPVSPCRSPVCIRKCSRNMRGASECLFVSLFLCGGRAQTRKRVNDLKHNKRRPAASASPCYRLSGGRLMRHILHGRLVFHRIKTM